MLSCWEKSFTGLNDGRATTTSPQWAKVRSHYMNLKCSWRRCYITSSKLLEYCPFVENVFIQTSGFQTLVLNSSDNSFPTESQSKFALGNVHRKRNVTMSNTTAVFSLYTFYNLRKKTKQNVTTLKIERKDCSESKICFSVMDSS